jgi:hypothetical protein
MNRRYDRTPNPWKVLMERDLKIVWAVFESIYMTNQHIAYLFFDQPEDKVNSQCRDRLAFLYRYNPDPDKFKSGMIDKRGGYVNERDIYFLGEVGIDYIAKNHPKYGKWDVKRFVGERAKNKASQNIHMSHQLSLTTLYVRARKEAQRMGYTLCWKNTKMMQREMREKGFRLVPDAWIGVYDGEAREAYIEFTADLDDLLKKVPNYDTYLPDATVLWVTTSRDKLDRIGTEAIPKANRPERYHIALFDDCKDFLTKPVWRVFDGDRWQWRGFMG